MSFKLNWTPPDIQPVKATFEWKTEHAALVHEGGFTSGGDDYPARPFTDAALIETDLEENIFDAYQENEDLEEAFVTAMWGLFDDFHFMILDPRWDWPNDTRRRNGQLVRAGLRDIYDTGELYNSQVLTFSVEGVSDA